jgi:MFS family permease
VPSNLLMHRIGARLTMARIMILWGLISASTMFVSSPGMFYAMRFLLGMAEAGFFPGVVLYLTYWYPAQRRGRAQTLLVTGVAVAGVLGNPVSGWIMESTHGAHGLQGWQWLFLLEGLPSVLLGLLAFRYLDNSVAESKWLTPDERAVLTANIAKEAAEKSTTDAMHALRDGRVWLLALIYFCLASGLYGVNFWLPTIVKGMGITDLEQIGLVSAVPWLAAAFAMVAVARSADLRRERRYHVAVPALLGAVGLAASVPLAGHPVAAIAALALGTCGLLSSIPLCWSLATAFLGGAGAASGIALINSFGNLSGFAAPYLMGFIRERTGSTDLAMYTLAAVLVLGAVLVLTRVPAALVNR